MKNIFVFDVESTALYGSGFAVGAVVGTPEGVVIDKFELMAMEGHRFANNWVKENVLPSLKGMPTTNHMRDLRDKFYRFYQKHKETCTFWSDVNYPVETNFLADLVKDGYPNRDFEMPYPLYDVCNFVPVSIDRAGQFPNLNFTKHNPYHDALASYYCLIESFAFKTFGIKHLQ